MTWNVWQQFVEQNGSPLPGAEITVRKMSDNSIVSLASDASGTLLDNPFTADSTGFVRFYAEAGKYKITASKSGSSFSFIDITLGAASGRDVGAGANDVLDKASADALYAAIRKYNVAGGAPTVNDDITQGYTEGSQWIDTSDSNKLYQSFDSTTGAADWQVLDTGISLGTMALKDTGSGAGQYRDNQANEALFSTQAQLATAEAALQEVIDSKADEAPIDGKYYLRKDGAWFEYLASGIAAWTPPTLTGKGAAPDTLASAKGVVAFGSASYIILTAELAGLVAAESSESITVDATLKGGVFKVPTQTLTDADNAFQFGVKDDDNVNGVQVSLARVNAGYDWSYAITEFNGNATPVTGTLADAQVFDQDLAFAVLQVGTTVSAALFTTANLATPIAALTYDTVTDSGSSILLCTKLFATAHDAGQAAALHISKDAVKTFTGFSIFGSTWLYIDEANLSQADGVFFVKGLASAARSSVGLVSNGNILSVLSDALINTLPVGQNPSQSIEVFTFYVDWATGEIVDPAATSTPSGNISTSTRSVLDLVDIITPYGDALADYPVLNTTAQLYLTTGPSNEWADGAFNGSSSTQGTAAKVNGADEAIVVQTGGFGVYKRKSDTILDQRGETTDGNVTSAPCRVKIIAVKV